MKKIFFSLFSLMLLAGIITNAAFASTINTVPSDDEIKIVSEDSYETDINPTVEFVDTSLLGTTYNQISNLSSETLIQPDGVIHEEYDHSYYVYYTDTITGYNVGPRNSDKFLVSVARGNELGVSLTTEKSVSGSVQFEGSLATPIKQVINLKMTGNISGSYTHTYTTTQKYYFDESYQLPYNECSFYGAINYDRYSTVLKKYDVYNVYNGTVLYGTTEYYVGNVNVDNVKKPKNVVYSVPSVQ